MLAQLVHLGGGFLELPLERAILPLNPAGGCRQRLDQLLDLGGHAVRGQAPADVRQGLAVAARGLLRSADRLGHRVQLATQLIAGVADLIVQLGLGQEGGRELLGDLLGEDFAGVEQPLDLLAQGAARIADVVQPELDIQRRRPNLAALHRRHRLPGQFIGLRSAQSGFDVLGHHGSFEARRSAILASGGPCSPLSARPETRG